MKRTLLAATMALLLWGMPALGGPLPDSDGDGVSDVNDNCSDDINPGQADTDGDDCGNLCDADYDNNGVVAIPDFGDFVGAFATNDEEKKHLEPVPGGTVSIPDFGFFVGAFGGVPGPSGTTDGTPACP